MVFRIAAHAAMKKELLIIFGTFIIVVGITGFFLLEFQTPMTGWFKTGQDADILLSGIDFNNTGGALLFNHPKGIATDGQRLLLADTYNNRILIWNQIPSSNQPPDLVLGQKNFISNNPGVGLGELNWPVSVATDGQRIIVADTENDRILIWNSFPTQNGKEADIVLQGSEEKGIDAKGNILWPWAVWTNGEKLVAASTSSSQVLIWNTFPAQDNQPPDVILQLEEFGSPRSIGSDGQRLVIADHNAPGGQGTFFWKSFPTQNDQRYDFLLADPENALGQSSDEERQALWSTFDDQGRFIALGFRLYIWNAFPENESDAPDYIIGTRVPSDQRYYFYGGGDGSDIVYVNGKLYVVLSNDNKIVGFDDLPTNMDARPDFVIGSPDLYTNTLETNFFITNPVPATDGKSLFVSSDYDNKLYIWKNLPEKSGAKPDVVYEGIDNAWDNALFGNVFAVAGGQSVIIWQNLPFQAKNPDLVFRGSIGDVNFQELKGIAIDDKYFYLSDYQANKLYIWEGIPNQYSNPKIVLNVSRPWRLSSDGKYLVVDTIFDHAILIYEVDALSVTSEPVVINNAGGSGGQNQVSSFNLPQMAVASKGSLFIADTCFNRVFCWRKIEDAITGKEADVILGEKDLIDTRAEIGKDKLFWPAGIAFDGNFLWVGEFKFSGRLLRFSRK